MNYSLSVLNDSDSPSSFAQGNLSGRPDLTLGALNICPSLVSWEVDDKTLSHIDHRYIKIRLDFTPLKKTRQRVLVRFFFFLKIIKKNVFSLRSLIHINIQDTLDKWIAIFHQELKDIMKKCFKTKSFSHKSSVSGFMSDAEIERNKLCKSGLLRIMTM